MAPQIACMEGTRKRSGMSLICVTGALPGKREPWCPTLMRSTSTMLLLTALTFQAFAHGTLPPPPPPPPSETRSMPGLRQDLVIVSGTAAVEIAPDAVSFDVDVHGEG